MTLGQFSLSLAVKDIEKSKAFYEALGFSAMTECGSVEDKWLIMKHGNVMIGLFEGMFDENIITFNWPLLILRCGLPAIHCFAGILNASVRSQKKR